MGDLELPLGLIADRLRKGRVIPFLGAGASRGCLPLEPGAAAVPSGHDLALQLARKVQFPDDAPINLATVAQYFEVMSGRGGLNEELHDAFAHRFTPAPLHEYLAALPQPLLVVTTNYDTLIEDAFAAKKLRFGKVVHTTDPGLAEQVLWWKPGAAEPEYVRPNTLDVDLGTTSVVYKIHGAADLLQAQRDQYVITENDYVDFVTRLTRGSAVPSVLAEAFATRHFLFLGYGLRDWNLRVVLNRVAPQDRQAKSWAIEENPSPMERRFWQDRGVEVFKLTLAEFVDRLTG